YEVIPRVSVPRVAVRGSQELSWKCRQCGFVYPVSHLDHSELALILDDAAIPKAPVFGVDFPNRWYLVMSLHRARQIAASPHAVGASVSRIGTAGSHQIRRRLRPSPF